LRIDFSTAIINNKEFFNNTGGIMSTVNFSVPEDIKKRFNKVFAHHNKSHLIAELMKQAVEDYERQQRRAHAIDALLGLRSKQKPITEATIKKARQTGRP
jgi:metal-responsive CopG/Arc/MetJ family transcriptional regulator